MAACQAGSLAATARALNRRGRNGPLNNSRSGNASWQIGEVRIGANRKKAPIFDRKKAETGRPCRIVPSAQYAVPSWRCIAIVPGVLDRKYRVVATRHSVLRTVYGVLCTWHTRSNRRGHQAKAARRTARQAPPPPASQAPHFAASRQGPAAAAAAKAARRFPADTASGNSSAESTSPAAPRSARGVRWSYVNSGV